jgi:hypothetical protein
MVRQHWTKARAVALGGALALVATIAVANGGPAGAGPGGTFGTGGSLPDVGVLDLSLGATNAFSFVPADATPAAATQTIAARANGNRKCEVQLGGATLVALTASTPSGSALSPGLDADSLGVRSGSGGNASGTPCGLVDVNERLTLALAGTLADFEVDRAELDVEVRGNAVVRVDLTLDGGTVESFRMRTGTSVPAGTPVVRAGRNDFDCTPSSDSGSNSGANDNCRWLIEPSVPFDRMVLVAETGEFGLMGGADATPACVGTACDGGAGTSLGQDLATSDTLFHITDLSGFLDCGDETITAGGSGGDATVTGVRLDNGSGAEPCVPVPYVLTADGNQAQFLKGLGESQSSAQFVFDIDWVFELVDTGRPAVIAPTQHSFDGDPVLDLELCDGTPLFVSGAFAGISELQGTPHASFDLDPSAAGVQYACYLTQLVSYVGDDQVELAQAIYVYGDWVSFR